MKRNILLVAAVLSCAELGNCFAPQERWQDITSGIEEADLKTIAVCPKNPNIFYCGSAKSIFKSVDAGQSWQKLYIVRGTNTAVNTICLDPKNSDIVYAGTQNGLFKTTDGGATWNKIFEEAIGNQEKEIRHMATDASNPSRIYIGTANGLFIGSDGGRMWKKLTKGIGNEKINFIAIGTSSVNTIYLATTTGIFKSQDSGITWERTLSVKAQNDETEIEETTGDSNTDDSAAFSNRTPTCIAIDRQDTKRLYIGTNSGVLVSNDDGRTFNKITEAGLINRNITSLIISDNGILYAATGGGVFRISRAYESWEELYDGLISKEVRFLAYDKNGNSIFAAAKKGLHMMHLAPVPNSKNPSHQSDPEIERLLANFKHEPTIQEVQDAAIRYAEVNKEKIEEWRKSAKRKALLPTMSVGVDHGVKNTSEIYTSATRSYWEIGPDNKSTGWDVTVKWDLGELIWNDDQTGIDVRSRLMVQLRDDILNEVTRLYFERRKLQITLLMNPPKNIQLGLEKELRLQELTAGIDALTGGWFSKMVEEAKH